MGHYFDEAPAVAPGPGRDVALTLRGATVRMRTLRGTFSPGAVDPGTVLLLRRAPPPRASGTIVDVGCGYGPIALVLAAWSPGASVVAVDVNERARRLTATNATANGLGNVTVYAPDDVPADLRVDEIWSNPPVRAGKAVLHDLLVSWLARLAPGGTANVVVHRHLGSDSLQRWLDEQGWPARRIASSKGYRILRVTC